MDQSVSPRGEGVASHHPQLLVGRLPSPEEREPPEVVEQPRINAKLCHFSCSPLFSTQELNSVVQKWLESLLHPPPDNQEKYPIPFNAHPSFHKYTLIAFPNLYMQQSRFSGAPASVSKIMYSWLMGS